MEKYWDDRLVFPPAKGKAPAPDVTDEDLPDDRQYTVKTLPQAASITASTALPTVTKTPKDSLLSEYDRKRQMRVQAQTQTPAQIIGPYNGWRAELAAWLDGVELDVTNETDLCEYWSVST